MRENSSCCDKSTNRAYFPDAQNVIRSPTSIGEGIWRIRNRRHNSNTYLCRLEDGESGFVIDPGIDEESILKGIDALGLNIVAIFCTHGHFDHVGSATALRNKFGSPIHLHEADLPLLQSANFHMLIAQVPGRISIPKVDVAVTDGTHYFARGELIEFIHTPGHTLGSCCIRFGKYVFTGDTLYRDSLGLVNFPGEDPVTLQRTLRSLWNTLPPSSVICPGHGGAGLFNDIKANNKEVIEFLVDPPIFEASG